PQPAGGAVRHRGPHRLRAAVLQRLRLPLQHEDPELPGQPRGQPVPVHRAGVLRSRRRRPRPRGRRLRPGPGAAHPARGLTRARTPRRTTARVYDQIAQNKRRSTLLIGGFVLLVVAVGAAINLLVGGGPVITLVALLIAGASAAVSYWKSDAIALRVSRARPAPEEQYPRYHNLVEGLCIAGGVPKPRLYVIDDPSPNAFATGRNPKNAAIAVTTGLLEKMNRVELEGVLAHELSHIKNYDILVSTLAVTLVGTVALVADLGIRLLWFGMGRSRNNRGDARSSGPLVILSVLGFALLLLSPIIGKVLQATISRRRETLADISAVELTRYPPGLISALEKLRDDYTVVGSTSHATALLWIEQPQAVDERDGRIASINRLFDTHPPLEERIALLREL